MHRETKATGIPERVKAAVWARDGGECVLCGNSRAGPWCHYIRRSQGGLGIEPNIWTGCEICHRDFDSESNSGPLHEEVAEYLRDKYPGWDEIQKIYRKHGGIYKWR